MFFSFALLIIIGLIAFKISPVEKKEPLFPWPVLAAVLLLTVGL